MSGIARRTVGEIFHLRCRQPDVDETALLTALQERRIAGAAIDVFVEEPLPPDHPFWALDNAFLTPHPGGFCDV